MTDSSAILATVPTEFQANANVHILVVDDSRLQCRLLSVTLGKWGYKVFEAESAESALAICRTQRVDIVVSDWMMPGMDGLEFCRRFRVLDRENYGYFILLTSKDEKGDIAKGLDVGADDFLTKPVNSSELHARIRAGERVLGMQAQLVEKNRSISETLAEIQGLYHAIDRDLCEAKKLQMSLLPETYCVFSGAQVSMLLQSSGHVGGDMVGFYHRSKDRIGLYAFDVSGHGVSSALMTARLAGCLAATNPAHSIAMRQNADLSYSVKHPAEIAAAMNHRMLEELDTDLYLTILIADLDLKTGELTMVQAGHPYPAIQACDGTVRFVGDGGLPVGLLPAADFAMFQDRLNPGERLLIYSDGFTEAADDNDALLNEEGMSALLLKHRDALGRECLSDLVWDVLAFSKNGEAEDDLSAILVEFTGWPDAFQERPDIKAPEKT